MIFYYEICFKLLNDEVSSALKIKFQYFHIKCFYLKHIEDANSHAFEKNSLILSYKIPVCKTTCWLKYTCICNVILIFYYEICVQNNLMTNLVVLWK